MFFVTKSSMYKAFYIIIKHQHQRTSESFHNISQRPFIKPSCSFFRHYLFKAVNTSFIYLLLLPCIHLQPSPNGVQGESQCWGSCSYTLGDAELHHSFEEPVLNIHFWQEILLNNVIKTELETSVDEVTCCRDLDSCVETADSFFWYILLNAVRNSRILFLCFRPNICLESCLNEIQWVHDCHPHGTSTTTCKDICHDIFGSPILGICN